MDTEGGDVTFWLHGRDVTYERRDFLSVKILSHPGHLSAEE